MDEERSIHRVRVQTSPQVVVVLPWKSAQDFVARCFAAYPTVHPLVEKFRGVSASRPGALALQLEATISTWCDRDLDLAGVVLDAAGGQGVVPVDLAGGTGVAHRSPLV